VCGRSERPREGPGAGEGAAGGPRRLSRTSELIACESPSSGFNILWADLQPVRALAITVLVAQLAGALLGFFFAAQSSWFIRLWLGGALATFPCISCRARNSIAHSPWQHRREPCPGA
jgi:hypothetical protein